MLTGRNSKLWGARSSAVRASDEDLMGPDWNSLWTLGCWKLPLLARNRLVRPKNSLESPEEFGLLLLLPEATALLDTLPFLEEEEAWLLSESRTCDIGEESRKRVSHYRVKVDGARTRLTVSLVKDKSSKVLFLYWAEAETLFLLANASTAPENLSRTSCPTVMPTEGGDIMAIYLNNNLTSTAKRITTNLKSSLSFPTKPPLVVLHLPAKRSASRSGSGEKQSASDPVQKLSYAISRTAAALRVFNYSPIENIIELVTCKVSKWTRSLVVSDCETMEMLIVAKYLTFSNEEVAEEPFQVRIIWFVFESQRSTVVEVGDELCRIGFAQHLV